MLFIVLNHRHNDAAIRLKTAFSPYADVLAIDSGSDLSPTERPHFDIALPNVYYCGLLNAATRAAQNRADDEIVYLWSSDVSHQSPADVTRRATEAFADARIGTYAPSAWFSGHPQMWNKHTGTLRRVLFVEGFCFATRVGLLRALCPIDTSVNTMGWGVDIQLGYLTLRHARRTVVDDRIEVRHPKSTGYSTTIAHQQRVAWTAQLPPSARRFHLISQKSWSKRRPFSAWLCKCPW